jgi:hypothetical protein
MREKQAWDSSRESAMRRDPAAPRLRSQDGSLRLRLALTAVYQLALHLRKQRAVMRAPGREQHDSCKSRLYRDAPVLVAARKRGGAC